MQEFKQNNPEFMDEEEDEPPQVTKKKLAPNEKKTKDYA